MLFDFNMVKKYTHESNRQAIDSDSLLCWVKGNRSHVPVLDFITSQFPIENIIEFGMGKVSTPLLAHTNINVTSVENSSKWFEKTKTGLSTHRCILWPNKDLQDYLSEDLRYFDLGFIDSDTVSCRIACVNKLMERRARFLVLHDMELFDPSSFDEQGYTLVVYGNLIPETGIFVLREDDLKVVKEFCQPVKCLL